jgi:hypothetical protein
VAGNLALLLGEVVEGGSQMNLVDQGRKGNHYWGQHTSAELGIDADEQLLLVRMVGYMRKAAHKGAAWLVSVRQQTCKATATVATVAADMRPLPAVETAAVVAEEVEFQPRLHKYVVGYHSLKPVVEACTAGVVEAYTAGVVDGTLRLDGLEKLLAA